MAKTTTTEEKQVATAQALTYSIKDAAKELKRSESSVKNYKRVLLEAWNKEDFKVVSGNGSLTEFGLQELREIMKYAKQGNPEQYISVLWAMHPKLSQEKDSGDPVDQGIDQGIDQGNVGSAIEISKPVEVEVCQSEEMAESNAIERFQAKKEIAVAKKAFFGEVVEFRAIVREMVFQEVAAGVMEGVSLGFTQGKELMADQHPDIEQES